MPSNNSEDSKGNSSTTNNRGNDKEVDPDVDIGSIHDDNQKVDISLTSVMDYIKGGNVDSKRMKEYDRLLRNFKGNFTGYLAMTAYKQMDRLARLLDRQGEIEERLYMDYDQMMNGSGVENGERDGTVVGTDEQGNSIKGVSERSEESLLAMSQRITSQIQNTLGFLMTLLDRMEKKNMPDKIDMIQDNKALPESSTTNASRLDASGRKKVRNVLKELQKELE